MGEKEEVMHFGSEHPDVPATKSLFFSRARFHLIHYQCLCILRHHFTHLSDSTIFTLISMIATITPPFYPPLYLPIICHHFPHVTILVLIITPSYVITTYLFCTTILHSPLSPSTHRVPPSYCPHYQYLPHLPCNKGDFFKE